MSIYYYAMMQSCHGAVQSTLMLKVVQVAPQDSILHATWHVYFVCENMVPQYQVLQFFRSYYITITE
ncbi:hypothetical protein P8452_53282 [Trifolium repens]|nr:hypothetical protein P8452_53282 [Trifolium repens]